MPLHSQQCLNGECLRINIISQQATSRRKGPILDRPVPKSEGGFFEPSVHLDSNGRGRVMDTDA
jgi:hypothetical protein